MTDARWPTSMNPQNEAPTCGGHTGLGSIPAQERRPSTPMPQTATDLLSAAADLLASPGAWTQRAFSRDRDGNANAGDARWAVDPVCYCVRGALFAVVGAPNPDALLTPTQRKLMADAEGRLERLLDYNLVAFNDATERTQAEVVEALRQAANLSGTAKAAANQ